jgi:hypothetical protein
VAITRRRPSPDPSQRRFASTRHSHSYFCGKLIRLLFQAPSAQVRRYFGRPLPGSTVPTVAGGGELMRRLLGGMLQAAADAEATARIGGGLHERSNAPGTTQRKRQPRQIHHDHRSPAPDKIVSSGCVQPPAIATDLHSP